MEWPRRKCLVPCSLVSLPFLGTACNTLHLHTLTDLNSMSRKVALSAAAVADANEALQLSGNHRRVAAIEETIKDCLFCCTKIPQMASEQLLRALYIDEDSGEAQVCQCLGRRVIFELPPLSIQQTLCLWSMQVVDKRYTADNLLRYAELADAAIVIAEAAVVASRSGQGVGGIGMTSWSRHKAHVTAEASPFRPFGLRENKKFFSVFLMDRSGAVYLSAVYLSAVSLAPQYMQ